MRRALFRLALALLFLTLVLLVLVLTVPGQRTVFLSAYELAAAAIAVFALLRRLPLLEPGAAAPSAFDRVPEEPEQPNAVADLDRIDRLIVLGSANSFDLHYRLRPLLRELAAARLHAAHGVDLDREPERARRLLGGELWEVVRPDRELENRFGPGLRRGSLDRIVAELEAL